MKQEFKQIFAFVFVAAVTSAYILLHSFVFSVTVLIVFTHVVVIVAVNTAIVVILPLYCWCANSFLSSWLCLRLVLLVLLLLSHFLL